MRERRVKARTRGKRPEKWQLAPLYSVGARADSSRVQFRLLVGTLALAAVAGGCASTGYTPHPFPTPGGSTGAPHGGTPVSRPSPGRGDAYAITGTALALRGAPYRNGGADPSGFDCSGFTQYVFGQHGVALPRSVGDQFKAGRAVKPDEITTGDLLFFTTVAAGATHVAIALGGDEFIHAPSSTGVVRVERLGAPYWAQRFLAARRIN
jgi:cell wall-associated NlpC family hydrolase